MATYKKGYKKQNPETVLLKVIIGIIVTVFVLVGVLFVYDSSTKWKNYTYFTTITELEGIFDYTNGGTEPLDDYVLYFYSTNESSQEIQIDVLREGKDINKDSEMFFLVNSTTLTDTDTYSEEFLDTIDEETISTPMVVVVVDGEFYETYVGSQEVLDVLESIEEGTFDAFNE